MVEKAEVARAPPLAGEHVAPVGEQAAPQRHGHRDGVLGNGVRGVTADVGNDDAVLPAPGEVDVVGAGGSAGDHLQLGQGGEQLAAQHHLVGDDDAGLADARGDVRGGGERVLVVVVREVRPAEFAADGVALQEDDAVPHWPCLFA